MARNADAIEKVKSKQKGRKKGEKTHIHTRDGWWRTVNNLITCNFYTMLEEFVLMLNYLFAASFCLPSCRVIHSVHCISSLVAKL